MKKVWGKGGKMCKLPSTQQVLNMCPFPPPGGREPKVRKERGKKGIGRRKV